MSKELFCHFEKQKRTIPLSVLVGAQSETYINDIDRFINNQVGIGRA
jgi:hypothetical protein